MITAVGRESKGREGGQRVGGGERSRQLAHEGRDVCKGEDLKYNIHVHVSNHLWYTLHIKEGLHNNKLQCRSAQMKA